MRWSCTARVAVVALATVVVMALGASAAAASSTLLGGQTLGPGQSLTSADGHYLLSMQTDGNLVLYEMNGSSIHRAVWSTGTHGDNGARAVLQSDGNLVLYSPSNEALWSTNTSTIGCANLVVQDDGNVVLYKAGSRYVWSSHTVNRTLQPGDELLPGQRIFSADEHFEIYMQTDGNLVLYGPTGSLWSSGTWGIPGNHAIMQTDGNLVVYSSAGRALWSSGTSKHSGASATMQDDANFVIYSSSGTALWSTKTAGKAPDRGKSQWSVPAFTACPPPAPPPAASGPPADPVVKVPVATELRRLRLRVSIFWTWDLARTQLYRIRIPRLSHRATVLVSCRGPGCHGHRLRVSGRRLKRLKRLLEGRTYRSGDRLEITILVPGHRPEKIAIHVRYGKVPRVRLL